MDTLLLVQDDPEHLHAIYPNGESSPPVPFSPPGTAGISKIPSHETATEIRDRVLKALVAFADTVTKKQADDNKKKINPADAETFQVILEYHQTNLGVALAIMDALRVLPNDVNWRAIPKKYQLDFWVKNVWLLSCESGGNKAKNAKEASRYAKAAQGMIQLACSGFKTERQNPPSNPSEYLVPNVFAFDTGDIVHGSTSLDPTKVSFQSTPFWKVDSNGNLEGDQRPIDPDQKDGSKFADFTIPSSGTIYQYNDGQISQTYDYPAAAPPINLTNFTPPK